MKKIFTSLMTVSLTVIGFGQIANVSEVATSAPMLGTDSVHEIIVSQSDDLSNGIVSDFFTDLGAGVYCADDFDMPFNGKLTKLTAYGFNNGGNFMDDTTSVRFYIMDDDNGIWMPNSTNPEFDALYSFDVPLNDPALTVDATGRVYLTLDLEVLGADVVLLEGEKYWLSVTPVMNDTNADGTLRWNWLMSSTQDFPAEALLIDPDELFGVGTEWTSIQGLGLPSPNLAMQIEAVPVELGVTDLESNVSFFTYPNPTTNFVKVSLDGADVKEMAIFSLDGRKLIESTEASVRVTSLPAGVYVVKVIDTKGNVHTSKVVKK
ncbi:MAG: T9SS type A sorting domain-containing protein [Weeksellaceae bacterium]|jgi:hypothetical protein|nr:T9SS type A sorting domain-containing protein [Weeksellaceae bacterium]MDX9704264.1 T9SS type A sorting domain-containing protein [Weeksellaceae bacterium]